MSMDLTVIEQTLAAPEARELIQQLPSQQLYALEAAGHIATEVLDERVIAWAEEGKTQQWMADEMGCTQQAVSKRMARLDIKTAFAQERPSVGSHHNSVVMDEVEEIEDAEVEVLSDGPAAEWLPDLVSEDADQDLRTQVVRWFEIGRRIEQLLDAQTALNFKSPADQKAIARDADLMVAIARRIGKEAR